jgi:hypothetical protein
MAMAYFAYYGPAYSNQEKFEMQCFVSAGI